MVFSHRFSIVQEIKYTFWFGASFCTGHVGMMLKIMFSHSLRNELRNAVHW